MILRREGDRLIAVRQVDHARFSGELAAAWGGATWDLPEPGFDVVIGATRHDDAWAGCDAAPELRDGQPLAFHEVDRVTTTALYAAGVAGIVADNAYAGLMASLHYSGFFSSHWGWQPFSTPDRFPEPQASALRGFIAVELARQAELRRAIFTGPGEERRLEVNYKWLQLWDRVSLDICRNPVDQSWTIEYPPTPTRYRQATEVALKFAMVAPGRYTLNPYPLIPAPLAVSIPSVRLPPGPFYSREAFLEAWRTAPALEITGAIEPV